MITKPSIADLLEGVTLTLERVVLPDPAASGQVLTELLGVIDRVAGEWPDHVRHLTDDNADMRSSLRRMRGPHRRRLGLRRAAGGAPAVDRASWSTRTAR